MNNSPFSLDSAASIRRRMLIAILSKAEPFQQRLYDYARQWVTGLERSVPWQRLYDGPEHPGELAAMAMDLVSAIDQLSARLEGSLDRATEPFDALAPAAGALRTLHLVHSVLSQDLERLRRCCERAHILVSDPSEAMHLRELIAEVKGKYCDAIIGATAALVAGDHSNRVFTEHLLFPERAFEARSAHASLSALRQLGNLLEKLGREQLFAAWITSWRAHERIDRYALVPLILLRSALGTLLDSSNRRALHLADFNLLCQRETLLSEAVAELELLHLWTWNAAAKPAAVGVYESMVSLTLEVASILDVEHLLRSLIGDDELRALRDLGDVTSIAGTTERLRLLLRQDDLRIVVGIMRGSMRKRGSLQKGHSAAPPIATGPVPGARRSGTSPERITAAPASF